MLAMGGRCKTHETMVSRTPCRSARHGPNAPFRPYTSATWLHCTWFNFGQQGRFELQLRSRWCSMASMEGMTGPTGHFFKHPLPRISAMLCLDLAQLRARLSPKVILAWTSMCNAWLQFQIHLDCFGLSFGQYGSFARLGPSWAKSGQVGPFMGRPEHIMPNLGPNVPTLH